MSFTHIQSTKKYGYENHPCMRGLIMKNKLFLIHSFKAEDKIVIRLNDTFPTCCEKKAKLIVL